MKMNARKSIFVIAALALLTVSSLFGIKQLQTSSPTPSQIADGTRPLPPMPPSGGIAS